MLVNAASRLSNDGITPRGATVVCVCVLATIIAFALFQKFAFGDSGHGQLSQIFHFTVVNTIGLGVMVGVSSFVARGVPPAIGWTSMPNHSPAGGRPGAIRHLLPRTQVLHRPAGSGQEQPSNGL